MQRLFITTTLLMGLSLSLLAQKTAPAKKVAPKPTAKTTTAVLKNQVDSFSYAIGLSIANFYKEQGITEFNSAMVIKALNDAKGQKTLLSEDQVNNTIMTCMQQKKAEKSAVVRKEGEAFLATNKTKPGVVTTASGLQYTILKEGTGVKPTAEDKVKVHYHGTLINGTVFDSSVDRGEPIVLSVNGVIRGWVEALQLMPVGSKWKLFIPYNLAYGDNDAGPTIKAGSALIFDVELLEIVKEEAAK